MQTAGIGVLNNSTMAKMNIGISIGLTHYYENGVEQGKISFHRAVQAMHTVYAYAADKYGSNNISMWGVEASRREARVPREGDPVSALPTTPCVSSTSGFSPVSSMSAWSSGAYGKPSLQTTVC